MAIEETTDRASDMMVNLIHSLSSTNIVTPDQLCKVRFKKKILHVRHYWK